MTSRETPDTPVDFAALGLDPTIVTAAAALGYEEPTPIQREAIPILLEGRDVLGQAATGTGKTAAFALPMLQRINEDGGKKGRTSGLVLVPTRELAMQVAEAVHKYAKGLGLSVVPVYGGAPMDLQIRALRRGADVVVATPGRALDHVNRRTLDLAHVTFLALDEADEMLDMGFADDLEAILSGVPGERQTALFSATMPPRIAAIAARHLHDPARVTIAREKTAAGKVPRVRQVAYVVARQHKPLALGRVLEVESPSGALVFCRTRLEVDELVETMNAHGYRAEALHGGMVQKARDRVMGLFRAQKVDLLVATDVAARGLDIDHLSHVVNYDVPSAPEAYVHRIGRTGRIGRAGVAITLAEPRETRQLRNIEAFTKTKIAIETVPTVADLRSRRLEVLQAALRERLVAGEFDDVRVVVESLSEEFDVVQIACAAIKMGMEADGPKKEEKDLPALEIKPPRPPVAGYAGKPGYAGKAPYAGKGDKLRFERDGRKPPRRDAGGAMIKIFIGAGREAGVRPGDLVGAITGETGHDSKVVGSIDITDRFSIVEIPKELEKEIIMALRATKIRGRKVTVNLDRGPKPPYRK
jgi:ATP-dependent RNA helicase DeaD